MDRPRPDNGYYRREAIGAFAHDLRTPLTALRMALDIGRQLARSADAVITLDQQLAGMVDDALGEIERLADALQESSRIERGKLHLERGPAALADVLSRAAVLAGDKLHIEQGPPGATGLWDADRLAAAVASVATAVARLAGAEAARLAAWKISAIELEVRAGEPAGDVAPFAADAGFGYFHARQVLEAMGATVTDARGAGFATVRVSLPG
ncbi:MAG: hypothetical protein Kow0010_11020 [Dehalococcoidia bacterium]